MIFEQKLGNVLTLDFSLSFRESKMTTHENEYNGEKFDEINMKMMAKYYSRGMQSKDQVELSENVLWPDQVWLRV